jgi:hypothetical protein
VLREVLLASPFGRSGVGRSVVGLLDGAGLLARPDVVEALLVVECDDAETPVFADLDLYAVAVASRGDHGLVDLDDPAQEPLRRLLGVIVLLVDLDAELAELPDDARALVVGALRAVADQAAGGLGGGLRGVGQDIVQVPVWGAAR